MRSILPVLEKRYGGSSWLEWKLPLDPVDLMIRTILSQNTSDRNRERGYDALKVRFPEWGEVLRANLEDLEEAIRPAGLAKQKARSIRAFLRRLESERGSLDLGFIKGLQIDDGVAWLTAIRGIGIKSAYIVLAFAFGKDLCAVDTHVHRILKRVGIIEEGCGREKAHLLIRPMIPRGKAGSLHLNLIDFGKELCTARKPRCPSCPIKGFCRTYLTDFGTFDESRCASAWN